MSFQLVHASDSEIVVWHVDHGHIFVFEIPSRDAALHAGPIHEVADAVESADAVADAALRFATEEARARQLIGMTPRSCLRTSIVSTTPSTPGSPEAV